MYSTIRNYQNYNALKRYKGEKNFGPNLVEPEQTLSLSELLKRHTAGQSTATFAGNFEDQDDPLAQYDLQRLDKIERMQLLQETQDFIKHQKQIANEKANEQIRTERTNAIRKQEELEAEIKQLRDNRTNSRGEKGNNERPDTTG